MAILLRPAQGFMQGLPLGVHRLGADVRTNDDRAARFGLQSLSDGALPDHLVSLGSCGVHGRNVCGASSAAFKSAASVAARFRSFITIMSRGQVASAK
jgi:hypothetical protein